MREIELNAISLNDVIIQYIIGPTDVILKAWQDKYPECILVKAKVPTELTDEEIKANIWQALQEPID